MRAQPSPADTTQQPNSMLPVLVVGERGQLRRSVAVRSCTGGEPRPSSPPRYISKPRCAAVRRRCVGWPRQILIQPSRSSADVLRRTQQRRRKSSSQRDRAGRVVSRGSWSSRGILPGACPPRGTHAAGWQATATSGSLCTIRGPRRGCGERTFATRESSGYDTEPCERTRQAGRGVASVSINESDSEKDGLLMSTSRFPVSNVTVEEVSAVLRTSWDPVTASRLMTSRASRRGPG